MLGADNPMQAPTLGHDKQDSLLDTEYTIKKFNFAIKNLKSSVQPGTGCNRIPYNLQFSKRSFRNPARNL
jgi:hypothetical protein